MDLCAELTLRLIRIGQEALDPRSSMIDWTFFPEMRRASWSDARDILVAAPKPALVAALVEPGAVALWTSTALEGESRSALEYQVANQCEYYNEKLAGLGLVDSDEIETPDSEFRLPVSEFRRWATEYCISSIGVGMTASQSPRIGRLLVRVPGGGQPPVGWTNRAG